MQVKFCIILTIFLCQLSLIQCNASKYTESTKDYSSNPYFPVRIGSQWSYVNESDAAGIHIIKVESNDINVKEPVIDNFITNRKMRIRSDTEGNITLLDTSGVMYNLLPSAVNFKDCNIWKYSDILTAYMTAAKKTVKTPAGDFECIFVNYTDGFTFSYEIWYAKNTGIVKWGANRTNPPVLQPVYYVLKEYKQ